MAQLQKCQKFVCTLKNFNAWPSVMHSLYYSRVIIIILLTEWHKYYNYYYYNHFMPLWILSGTTQVSRHQKGTRKPS